MTDFHAPRYAALMRAHPLLVTCSIVAITACGGKRRVVLAILVASAGLYACGGGEEGDPLVSGSMTGEWDGQSFTPANGFATLYNDAPLIMVGDGPIHCGTEDANAPPDGTNAALFIDTLAVGDYGPVFVELHHNVGGYEGVGTNTGSVSITAVSDTAVAGSVSFDYTDDQSRHFAISGTFEVVHCPP